MRLKRILTWTVLTLLLACGTIWATSNSWNYPVPTLGGLTTGDVIYARSGYALGNISPSTIGQTLVSAGTGTAPVWSDTPRLGKQLRTYQATVPTCSTNCGTSPSVVGTDSAGLITLGSTPSNDYVLVFNATWEAAPVCVAQQQTTGANYVTKSVSTTTTLTITGAAGPTAADKVKYICIGKS